MWVLWTVGVILEGVGVSSLLLPPCELYKYGTRGCMCLYASVLNGWVHI